MATVDLKTLTIYNEDAEGGAINYQGNGAAFLKKDLSEKLHYCDDLEKEEAEEFFKNHEEYYFGECNLEWVLESKPPMGRGKIAMWFAKYWANGYYEQPFA